MKEQKGRKMTTTYVSLDLETTGLNPKIDKIIEIGAVKVIEGKVVDTYSTFVNPGRTLTDDVKKLTGITDIDLENAPAIAEVLESLVIFLEDMTLVGHRIIFDYSFVKKAATNQGLNFEKKGIDTLKIARKYLAKLESKKLDYLCGYYHIPLRAHRALEDAKATSILYEKLANAFYQEGDFTPSPLLYKVKKEGPITKKQKERIDFLLEKFQIQTALTISMLTKNEASRYIDKLLAKHGR